MVAGNGVDGDSGVIPGTEIRLPFLPAVPRVDKILLEDDRGDIIRFFDGIKVREGQIIRIREIRSKALGIRKVDQ